jgi:hypothetical protein
VASLPETLGSLKHGPKPKRWSEQDDGLASKEEIAGMVDFYAAIFNDTCLPAFVAIVINISRLNFSHLPVIKPVTGD